VEYVVALSGSAHWQEHSDAITASGVVNTQLGPGEFLENFAMWSEAIKTSRTVREPYPDVVAAPISIDDIARVAAALLVEPDASHYGQSYELTGPQALTRAQIAVQIGVGIGIGSTSPSRCAAGPMRRPRFRPAWAGRPPGTSTRSPKVSARPSRPIHWWRN
jgi:dTDP-4-dehydrorhamnose reductase